VGFLESFHPEYPIALIVPNAGGALSHPSLDSRGLQLVLLPLVDHRLSGQKIGTILDESIHLVVQPGKARVTI